MGSLAALPVLRARISVFIDDIFFRQSYPRSVRHGFKRPLPYSGIPPVFSEVGVIYACVWRSNYLAALGVLVYNHLAEYAIFGYHRPKANSHARVVPILAAGITRHITPSRHG